MLLNQWFERVCALCVRALFSLFGFDGLPRRSLGGAGGPAAPFRGARGDTPLDSGYVIYGHKWSFVSPPLGGGLGGSHRWVTGSTCAD